MEMEEEAHDGSQAPPEPPKRGGMGGPARGREQDKYGYYTFFKFYYKYFSTPSGLVSLGGSVLNTDTNNTSTAINCLLGVALKNKIGAYNMHRASLHTCHGWLPHVITS